MTQETTTSTDKKVTLSDGTVVTVRKPKLRDIRAHFNEPNLEERQVQITGTLAQMTIDELDDLDMDDFNLLFEAATSFLSQAGMSA